MGIYTWESALVTGRGLFPGRRATGAVCCRVWLRCWQAIRTVRSGTKAVRYGQDCSQLYARRPVFACTPSAHLVSSTRDQQRTPKLGCPVRARLSTSICQASAVKSYSRRTLAIALVESTSASTSCARRRNQGVIAVSTHWWPGLWLKARVR